VSFVDYYANDHSGDDAAQEVVTEFNPSTHFPGE